MWSLTGSATPDDQPLLIVDDRVAAASPDVIAAGVALGMPRRDAEALAPFATVETRDLGAETRLFEPVVAAIEDLVPRVEVVGPGLVFARVDGATRFYGSEEEVARRVDGSLSTFSGLRGGEALVGLAEGPFAARWAAAQARPGSPMIVEDTISFLSRLDLGSLREAMGGEEMIDTFRWLGITTLGDLAGLPRDTVASRFGTHGLVAHRLASGEDRDTTPREIPPDLGVTMTFEDPLENLETIDHAGRDLAEKLMRRLRMVGVAPHTVTITVEAASGARRERVWRSAAPFTEKALAERLGWQLRAWVETAGVPGGIAGLSIDPEDLSGEGRQLGLFTDESSTIETERALARAQAIVGPDRVLSARSQGGRLPLERVAWSRWGEPESVEERDAGAPWPGATPGPAPALVPPEPRPIAIEWEDGMPSRVRLGARWEPVLTWSGPWRLTGRWWLGEPSVDRYQIVTSVGAFLCVVDADGARLAGVYD